MASRFAYVQARISHGVKCLFRFLAEPHMHSCWLNKPRHPQLCQQDSEKKNQIPACLWDKYLSIFACPRSAILVSSFANDIADKQLAQKENLLAPEHQNTHFSSPVRSKETTQNYCVILGMKTFVLKEKFSQNLALLFFLSMESYYNDWSLTKISAFKALLDMKYFSKVTPKKEQRRLLAIG